MEVKVYVVSEVCKTCESDCVTLIAVRLTFAAARAIAKENGNRRIDRFIATKRDELNRYEEDLLYANHQHQEAEDGISGFEYISDSRIPICK